METALEYMHEKLMEAVMNILTKTLTSALERQAVDQSTVLKEVVNSCAILSSRLNAMVQQNNCSQKRIPQLESDVEQLSSREKNAMKNRLKDSKLEPSINRIADTKPPPTPNIVTNTCSFSKTSSRIKIAFTKDPCEVLVSGTSQLPKLNCIQIAHRLLTFARLSSLMGQVVLTRSWKPKRDCKTKSTV